MKMLPVQLSLNPPLGLWSDVLWRCPPAPPSQLAELKTQLPASLPSDPRLWSREDVTVFLRFCEREFDLPKLDYELFQMNGKALCLLNRADFGHRCPGAGDVLHNVLQMLIIESHMMQWHLPNSPVTPTSRYPLSPHSHPPTPTWPPIGGTPEQTTAFHSQHMHHFMAPNSVTLSPPPSVDSQASSPPQTQEQMANGHGNGSNGNLSLSNSQQSLQNAGDGGNIGSNGLGNIKTNSTSSSNHSDSDDESISDNGGGANNTLKVIAAANSLPKQYHSASPPTTPVLKDMPHSMSQITNSFVNSWSQQQQQQQQQQQMHVQKLQLPGNGGGGSVSAPTTPSFMQPVKREFFPENTEPNTNGRLLWDFLQQLLNDRNQKYSDLIAWKCRDTGVFKIVDPAGLAKLWGIQKNHLSMNYDKMSRALRYYYRVNILRKVQGERHCYQFLRNPTELKNIKNISLLRQSTANNNNGGPNGNSSYQQSAAAASSGGASVNGNGNGSSTNWPSQQQQQGGACTSPVALSSQAPPPQSPQRPNSRSAGGHPMSLPAVVAAAAAAGYGPPPSSPLFMHAINGAFHYLQTNSGGVTPKSPSLSTPNSTANGSSEANVKFQFHAALKYESSGGDSNDDVGPTDLSVAGNSSYSAGSAQNTQSSEKRSYQSSNNSSNGSGGGGSEPGCYPLIHNADGLTTIKLIRYNEDDGYSKSTADTDHMQHESASPGDADKNSENSEPMEGQCDINNDVNSAYSNLVPTDLRK